ncbi:HlyD family type I secretion periplasmic adaptor subunit [Polycladidibacter hongkongensis]|uniref:HlyD family type I secretion periplasmic adaptor subunit n=1 Tax=Polycladidibacter hongkongensis TaxID=1647556 RepID=UPI0009E8B8ED|nr:HlyD family type I secretion periplasmic adaptor subunit [Pseudovibrio hongkongensis]
MSSKELILGNRWHEDVPKGLFLPKLASVAIILVVFLLFGVWAFTAPLAGAVVARGSFVATGKNKIVQHLEGGIIHEILVKEGEIVSAGQVLVRLDETAARANMARLQVRQLRLQAVRERLEHEARNAERLLFPNAESLGETQGKAKEIILGQLLTFQAHRRKLMSEIAILDKGIAALEERIQGSSAQAKAVEQQLALLKEEEQSKRAMLSKGLIRKSDLLNVQRMIANLTGERGRILAEMGDARERIARTEAQIQKVRDEAAQSAAGELQSVLADLDDVREQTRAAQNVLERIEIRAPVRGAVVRMRYHTAGGVIEAGKDLIEILPLQEELVVEAEIKPEDIDHVEKGQQAMVRLSALNQRTTPMIPAEVTYVSVDAVPDERLQSLAKEVYKVKVKILMDKVANTSAFSPTPGMPAEIYITTRNRTFIDYLMEPLSDSMSRAFREP